MKSLNFHREIFFVILFVAIFGFLESSNAQRNSYGPDDVWINGQIIEVKVPLPHPDFFLATTVRGQGKKQMAKVRNYTKYPINKRKRIIRNKREVSDPLINLPIQEFDADLEARKMDGKSVRRRTGESPEDFATPAPFGIRIPPLDDLSNPRIRKLFPGLRPGISISEYENEVIEKFLSSGKQTNQEKLKSMAPTKKPSFGSQETQENVTPLPKVIPAMLQMQGGIQADLGQVIKGLLELKEATNKIFHYIVDIRAGKDKLFNVNLSPNVTQNAPQSGAGLAMIIPSKAKFSPGSNPRLAQGNVADSDTVQAHESTPIESHEKVSSVPMTHSVTASAQTDNKPKSNLPSAPAASASEIDASIIKRSDVGEASNQAVSADQIQITPKKRELEDGKILTNPKEDVETEARHIETRDSHSTRNFFANIKFVDDNEDNYKGDVVESKNKPSNFRFDTGDSFPSEGSTSIPNHVLHGLYDKLALTIKTLAQIKQMITTNKELMYLTQTPLSEASDTLLELIQQQTLRKEKQLAMDN